MHAIKTRFDEVFRAWQIELPLENLRSRQPGSINDNGWTINYCFGETGGRVYLDYFASHRMTNDTLNRIYDDGTREVLGYCQEFYLADNPQAEKAYFDHNQTFYKRVRDLGLL